MKLIGPIRCNGLFGFLNWQGDWVIEPRFQQLASFHEGMAGFVEGGKLGFINEAGDVAIEPRFVWNDFYIPSFREGVAAISEGYKTGYLDKAGDWRIPPRLGLGWQFRQGKAIFDKQEGYTVIDVEGNEISCLPADCIPFFEDFPDNWDWFSVWFSMDKAGAINWRGETILEPNYASLGHLRDGVAPYSLEDNHEGPFGLIHPTGRVVKESIFHSIGAFSEGLAPASITKRECGYVNPQGEFVIEPKYRQACDFNDGLACVTVVVPKGCRGNKGFINPRNEMVIEPRFQRQSSFHDGWAWVEHEGKVAVIDRAGAIIWERPLEYDQRYSLWT